MPSSIPNSGLIKISTLLLKKRTFTASIASIIGFGLAFLLCIYVVWELYWFSKVGLAFIKWHTHLVATALASMLVVLGIRLILIRYLDKGDERTWLVPSSIWMALMLCETLLITTGFNQEYSEERFGCYQSPFQNFQENVYNVFHANDTGYFAGPEFSYAIPYNSMGFTGVEWPLQKDSSRLRIICGGDSFTAGDGAPIDSSYPKLLAGLLPNYEILNAGVCGSDPVFGYKNLKERILAYKPDVYIQTISLGDLRSDIVIRGGFERFKADGTVQFHSPPWWETIYALSYTGRIGFHLFNLAPGVMPALDDHEFIAKTDAILEELSIKLQALAQANNFKVILVLLPEKSDLLDGHYGYNFKGLKNQVSQYPNLKLMDLLPCYESYAEKSNRAPLSYYWNIDGHHNSDGYLTMAHCISNFITKNESKLIPTEHGTAVNSTKINTY